MRTHLQFRVGSNHHRRGRKVSPEPKTQVGQAAQPMSVVPCIRPHFGPNDTHRRAQEVGSHRKNRLGKRNMVSKNCLADKVGTEPATEFGQAGQPLVAGFAEKWGRNRTPPIPKSGRGTGHILWANCPPCVCRSVADPKHVQPTPSPGSWFGTG